MHKNHEDSVTWPNGMLDGNIFLSPAGSRARSVFSARRPCQTDHVIYAAHALSRFPFLSPFGFSFRFLFNDQIDFGIGGRVRSSVSFPCLFSLVFRFDFSACVIFSIIPADNTRSPIISIAVTIVKQRPVQNSRGCYQ